jgi:hypothetical protein
MSNDWICFWTFVYSMTFEYCVWGGQNHPFISANRKPCYVKIKWFIFLYMIFETFNRGYSMLFDEYEIYFTSETGLLIFSRVRSSSENIIKILSHEWNKFHIHLQSIEFSIYYIFFCFSNIFVWNLKRFIAFTQHNVIIKNMTSQSVLLFSQWK